MAIDFILAAKELIAVNTVSENGNEEIIPLLRGLLQGMGMSLTVQRAEMAGVEHANLLGSAGVEIGGGLLLGAHVDTVDPGDTDLWTECGEDPFNAVVRGDRIFGLGTASGKLDWLAKVEAARRLAGQKLMRPLHIAATYGEQLGLLGAKQLASSGMVRAEFACVAEPTGLAVVYANKGYLAIRFKLRDVQAKQPAAGKALFRINCRGVPAHSAVPSMGDNAILRALGVCTNSEGRIPAGMTIVSIQGGDAINKVPDHCEVDATGSTSVIESLAGEYVRVEQITRVMAGSSVNGLVEAMVRIYRSWEALAKSLRPEENLEFDPPNTVYNLGWVSTTANDMEFGMDLRLLPGQDYDSVTDWIPRVIDEVSRDCPDVEIDGMLEMRADPMSTPKNGRLVTVATGILGDLGIQAGSMTKSVATEGSVYSAAGMETICFGPGSSMGTVHHPNESNSIKELMTAVDFYERLIRKICL